MKIRHFKAFNEKSTEFMLHDRLKVIVINKPEFSKTYVTISAPIGSIHQGYLENGNVVKTPAGVAHFLEHKVFEYEGQDISRIFAMKEAQLNAFTEHNRTTYLFNATDHVFEHITRLIHMFFYPQFTSEGIDKEKNIIKEELNMHLDDPYYIQYHTVLNHLFHHHPIKDDILGTKDSIDAITLDVLTSVHAAYYQAEHAALVIIGDIDEKDIQAHLESSVTLPKPHHFQPCKEPDNEPSHIKQTASTLTMDILIPSVLIGIKQMPHANGDIKTRLKQQLAFSIFMSLLFGTSGDYYEILMDKGLINDTYGLDVQLESSYGYIMIGSETTQPDALLTTLKEMLSTLKSVSIDKADFDRIKNQMFGNFIMSLDSLEHLAQESSRFSHENFMIYDLLDIAKSITYEDMLSEKDTINPENIVSVVMLPKNK